MDDEPREAGSAPPSDPWEEEIDLRQLFADVLRRWVWWGGIPVVVTLLAGMYFLSQPDRYRIRSQFYFNHNQPGVEQLELRFLPASVVEQKLYSVSLLESSYHEVYPGQPSDSSPVLSFMAGVSFETVRPQEQERGARSVSVYRLTMETSEPDSAATVLNAWTNRFRTWARRRLQHRLETMKMAHASQLESIQKEWEQWKTQLGRSMGSNGLPGFGSEPNGSPGGPSASRDFIPAEVELLQRNQQFLTETNTLSRKLFWCRQLLESPGELIEYFPAEPPGTPLRANPVRNTALAGVVTFLLTFFGITFWEIL